MWLETNYYQNLRIRIVRMLLCFLSLLKERIFEFLVRVNMEYNQVCIQVLGKESWTCLNEVFSVIRVEEGRSLIPRTNSYRGEVSKWQSNKVNPWWGSPFHWRVVLTMISPIPRTNSYRGEVSRWLSNRRGEGKNKYLYKRQ